MEYINIFYSVYLHIFLLFCFLTIFFWLVISKTEKKSLNNEINSGIKNNLKNITFSNKLFTDEDVDYFEKYYKDQDLNVSRNNKNLLQFNIAFIILLLIGFICSVYIIVKFGSKNNAVNWWEVIVENIIILLLVGGIEYYFFMAIASKYVPVMPSYLPNVIKNRIKNI